jgi:hypothetical protein
VPADKLILLSRHIEKRFKKLAEREKPRGRYSHFIDLQQTEFRYPAQLYCGGSVNKINKIVFVGLAGLGLTATTRIVGSICGDCCLVTIHRLDWCVDIFGISAWQFAMACHVAGVQSSKFYRSRSGVSCYPHASRERTLLVYERLSYLRSKHDPSTKYYKADDQLTRIEVQLCGKGVPIRGLNQIQRYADIDLLRNVTFLKFRPFRRNLKPLQLLAAHGLQALVQAFGLQNALKRFSAAESAYLIQKFFEPDMDMPDVHFLMQESTRDWLEDRLRFPRLRR